MTITVYMIIDPDKLFEPGEVLDGFNMNAVSIDDYVSERARALYAALDASPEDEDDEYILGELPDGRWALVGLTIAGHKFAVENVAPAADAR